MVLSPLATEYRRALRAAWNRKSPNTPNYAEPTLKTCSKHAAGSLTLDVSYYTTRFTLELGPAIPPIFPIPKPVVPVINPFPITPKPITPKPITPKPVSPKPISPKPAEPAQPPGSALQCKRAPGDPCTNVATFGTPELEGIRNKGRIVQADLLVTQRANPPAQDVDRADLARQYTHDHTDRQALPLPTDETGFLTANNPPVPHSLQNDWYSYTTTNLQGSGGKLPQPILRTHMNPKDRVMIVAESFNGEHDLLKSGKMRWSDMAMYDLKEAFKTGGVNPDELKYMVRHNIEGGGSASNTRNYIEKAIEITQGDRANVNTFRSDPYAPGITPQELAAYQLLAGSDHVHRVLLMLKDYPATMKNVRVESLRVYTPDTPGTDDGYHIVIMFTRVDNP
ncbi:hypothetical protein yc1106_03162 [Curvularia clavata]|uniref:Uncharacterized protein n=1 Tax=Curvularia clavata TaxID=95742 RepID=A0A9Q8Z8R8_CURCL|nr:hypothetical protein yc1106_03162 [Curvularia clavata]